MQYLDVVPRIEFHKYHPRYPPDIHVNEKEFMYMPLDPIEIPVPLNATNAAIDKDLTIKVSDPKNDGVLGNSMEYYVKIRQPPHPNAVKMESLEVWDAYEDVLKPWPPQLRV